MDPREIKPLGGTKKPKIAISTLYLLTPLALLFYRLHNGESPDTLVFLIVVILIFASAYAIYGERVVDKAADKAQEVTSDGDGEEEE